MNDSRDFIEWLGHDMSLKILMLLENPCDLVRVSAVSSSWRQFVIANGLSKKLCLRMFPQASTFAHVVEVKRPVETVGTGMNDSSEWIRLEREHRVYASLTQGLISFPCKDCISDAICASSTDNYPEESIINTLEPSDRVDHRASYWSSQGARSLDAPETLIYKLAAQLCLITEVHIHPFQAYFQFGFPIYSAKAVRFHIGHPKVPLEPENDYNDEFLNFQEFSDDKFEWTYTSQEFPMAHENRLQKFRFPEPVLCIGGILKVELLGRVQTQEIDGQYYICITHVQVVGRPLSPAFDVELLDEQGKCTLKYYPESLYRLSPAKSLEGESSSSSPSRFHRFSASIRTWEQMIVNTFRGAGPLMIEDDDSDYEYLD
ncbi:hypothetical protein ACJIZ3_009223 [Penstemon smallii]|uniref:F-box domain-containing protein n=1 Tax=Penstemon smallii TaxID=265156 RepID=A0ABD3TDV3_9LAMI